MCLISRDMEQKAFEIEIQRIRPHLINKAEQLLKDGEEAEDVVQDTILKLWTMRDRLDEYRSMEGLAVVMVRRLALNQMRTITVRKLWSGKKDNEDKSLTPDAELSPEEQLVMQEQDGQLKALISQLPDKQQAILRMKHLDGMETEQIAQLAGCSEAAVRQNLSRARRQIWKCFKR